MTQVERDEAVSEIRAALRRRSGKSWSVTCGRGTSWGWLTISAPPARRVGGLLSPEDARTLTALLSLEQTAHCQGVMVPASSAYRREYIDRANGRAFALATPYWD